MTRIAMSFLLPALHVLVLPELEFLQAYFSVVLKTFNTVLKILKFMVWQNPGTCSQVPGLIRIPICASCPICNHFVKRVNFGEFLPRFIFSFQHTTHDLSLKSISMLCKQAKVKQEKN